MALTRPEAATAALYRCGGGSDAVHTEDVAVAVAEIAPGMFAWEKYPDRIDKELVRVALSDARLKKGYVLGSHQQGWMLTPEGVAYAQRAAPVADAAPPTHYQRGKGEQASQRERARLLTSGAYEIFRSAGLDAITPDEADAFFRLNVYVRGQARERKIARLENQFGADPELGDLVTALARKAKERV